MPRDVEPDSLKIYDFVFLASEKASRSPQRFGNKEARHDRELHVAGRRDDVFFLDMVRYCEVEKFELTMEKLINGTSFELEKAVIKSHKIESVNALTFCWPYLCYSFKSSNLMIYNIFGREHIHNVVISEEQKRQEILAMYITETNDLFIVTKYKKSYLV